MASTIPPLAFPNVGLSCADSDSDFRLSIPGTCMHAPVNNNTNTLVSRLPYVFDFATTFASVYSLSYLGGKKRRDRKKVIIGLLVTTWEVEEDRPFSDAHRIHQFHRPPEKNRYDRKENLIKRKSDVES